jgi:hypothetical protein
MSPRQKWPLRIAVTPDSWGPTLPGAFWLLWAVALGAATPAYHLRRRGACRRCGRGAEPTVGLAAAARSRTA